MKRESYKKFALLSALIIVVVTSMVVLKISSRAPQVLGDRVKVDAYILSCELTITAVPQERVFNYFSTTLNIDIRNASTKSLLLTLNSLSNNFGSTGFNLCGGGQDFSWGNYIFDIKGKSHLTRRILKTPAFTTRNYHLDASTPGDHLIAGETGNVNNEEINSLDLTGALKLLGAKLADLGSGYDNLYDFMLDGDIDFDDIQVYEKNIYKTGEITRNSIGPVHPFANASFEFEPSEFEFDTCNEMLDIYIYPRGREVNAADIEVFYNQKVIAITDINPFIPNTQIITGDAFNTYLGHRVDWQEDGQILLTGGNYPGKPKSITSKALFATIPFTYFGFGGEWIDFTIRFDQEGETLDSNIADLQTGDDILSHVINGRYYFSENCAEYTPPPPPPPEPETPPPTIVISTAPGLCQEIFGTGSLGQLCGGGLIFLPILCLLPLGLLIILARKKKARFFNFVDTSYFLNYIEEEREYAKREAQKEKKLSKNVKSFT